jgi:hypothetical protein
LVDLFDEVDEELRSDRARSLIRTLIPWVIGALAVVLLGYFAYWGYTTWQDRNLAAASAAYQKGVDAMGSGDVATASQGYEATLKAGAPGYKTLALMQQGNLKLAAGDASAAAKLYDRAADAAPNKVIGDLARLKAAQALLDTAPLPQLTTRLTPLMETKRPYAIYAREALAMAKLMAGRTDDARKDFNAIQFSLTAPEDMRQRAQLAIGVIDAKEAPGAIAAVKAAATLPPMPASIVGAPPSAGSPAVESQAPAAPQSPPAGAAQ